MDSDFTIIYFKFKNLNLLTQSLTHKSFDKNLNNEKIEFLGDRVLGLVIAKNLLEIYPNEKEGILDKKQSDLFLKNVQNLKNLKSGQLHKLNLEVKKSKLRRNLRRGLF